MVLAGAFWLAVFLPLAILLGLFGGWLGLVIAAAVPSLWLALAWRRAAEAVFDLCEAEAADEVQHSRLFNTTAGLCAGMGVALPDLYVVDDPAINAMAVGTDVRNPSLVVTSGTLDSLTVVELEAMVGLLLYRIKSGAITAETLAIPTVGAVLSIAESKEWGDRLGPALKPVVALYTWVIARLHPRSSEIAIDLEAVQHTRFPPGLATALQKSSGRSALAVGGQVTAHLWIVPPVSARAFPAVLKIHAPTDDRVAVLEEL